MEMNKMIPSGRHIIVTAAVIGGVTLWALLKWRHFVKKKLMLPRANIHVINTSEEWGEFYPILKSHVETLKFVGFDCEWVFDKKRFPVALVQISTQQGLCLLVRMCKMAPDIPKTFKNFMSDRSILKVGVASKDDGKKLQKDYGIFVHGCVDLRYLLGRVRGIYQCQNLGLQGIADGVLGISIVKDQRIRCGNWEAEEFSTEQIAYAADDALVAVSIFTHLVLAKMLGRAPLEEELTSSDITEEALWKKARSVCQGIVDVPYKTSKVGGAGSCTQGLNSKDSADSASGNSGKSVKRESRAYSVRNRPLYYNCCLLAPDGQMLCTCDIRKVEWYIEKGLAEKVKDHPLSVKLKFEPAGRPKSEMDYYLQDKQNACVVCGHSDSYIKKLIIPKEYRKYFPPALKDHASHDVLLMCLSCHQRSCEHDSLLRQQLAEECEAPLDAGSTSRSFQDHELQRVRSAAKALLLNKSQIPEKRVQDLQMVVKNFYGVNSLDENILQTAAEMDIRVDNPAFMPHGKRVVQHVKKNGGLLQFEKRWRQHFLDCMKPDFLPPMWSVDHQHERYTRYTNQLTGDFSL